MNWQWAVVMVALWTVVPGCSEPDIEGFCAEREGCLGGNDKDVQACVVAFQGARDNAIDIGCGEEYDAALACVTPELICSDAGMCVSDDDCNGSTCIDGNCKRHGLDPDNPDACAEEFNTYSQCKY